MEPANARHSATLLNLAHSLSAAGAGWASERAYEPLSDFLAQVRQALGMEVAFVSRVARGTRIVEAVNADAAADAGLDIGDEDELDETYCQLMLDGSLGPVVKDAWAEPRLAALPITRRLRIRSYLSATIVLRSGFVFGTVCCYSSSARPDLQATDAAALQEVANAIAADIDRHGKLTERIWRWGDVG